MQISSNRRFLRTLTLVIALALQGADVSKMLEFST